MLFTGRGGGQAGVFVPVGPLNYHLHKTTMPGGSIAGHFAGHLNIHCRIATLLRLAGLACERSISTRIKLTNPCKTSFTLFFLSFIN